MQLKILYETKMAIKGKKHLRLYIYVLFLVIYIDESSPPFSFIQILKTKSERVKYPGQVCANN